MTQPTLTSDDPRGAAYAASRFLPADPAYWIECASQAGMVLWVDGDGSLHTNAANSQAALNPAHHIDPPEVLFLKSWLYHTPGGARAVATLLRVREAGWVARQVEADDDE
jgi:hypothetical protein